MPAQFRQPTPLHFGSSQYRSFLLLRRPTTTIPKFRQPRATPFLQMTTQFMSTNVTKRPTCPSCSKPTRLCLCNRLRTSSLHNSIAVTILQHTLEKKHPLNSARIAAIGLQNVDVVTVSDVNYQARFFIQRLESNYGVDLGKFDGAYHPFDEMPSIGLEAVAIDFTVGKQGSVTSLVHCRIAPEKYQEMGFDQLLASDMAFSFLTKGFAVKKLATKCSEGSSEYEEYQEFECKVPPGSVLLFPSESSVDVSGINFEVKNLIVLDGTWAKAKRMYSENPWLKMLPHLNLGSDKLSLYSEVRHQPRAGYLSTIESIVYAMKAVGEECDELDSLLDVFESMVGDQRRCKNERLSKLMDE